MRKDEKKQMKQLKDDEDCLEVEDEELAEDANEDLL